MRLKGRKGRKSVEQRNIVRGIQYFSLFLWLTCICSDERDFIRVILRTTEKDFLKSMKDANIKVITHDKTMEFKTKRAVKV